MPEKPITDPVSPNDDAGPFTSTDVKTIEISGPFKITVTTTYNASHVPPSSTSTAVDGDGLLHVLQPIAEMILAKLNEIRRAQGAPSA